MENREVVEGVRQVGKHKVMMPHGDVEGIPSGASVQAAEPQGGPNQHMDRIPVFMAEKVQPLPAAARFVVALNPKALLEVGRTDTPN